MSSNNDEEQRPPIQDPLVLHENYELMPTYKDDIIPGPPIEFLSLFEAIPQEAPTGIPLACKEDTLNYMYNIVQKVYGPECILHDLTLNEI